MNWKGQTLDLLGPRLEKVTAGTRRSRRTELTRANGRASPINQSLAQIRAHTNRTPTFIVHPMRDGLIPWQQAQRTYDALKDADVDAELRIVTDAIHLFDIVPHWEENAQARQAMIDGYRFLSERVQI